MGIVIPISKGGGLDFQPARYCQPTCALLPAGGSPFACACAALLPERVEALLLVCPLMPVAGREAELLPGTCASTLRLFHGVREHPGRSWASLHLLRLIQKVPHGNLLLHIAGFAEVDKQAMLELPEAAAIEKEAVREGLVQGVAGALCDMQVRAWATFSVIALGSDAGGPM